jgi:hypothetical protein
MTMQFADLARQAAAEGAVSVEDILALRRAGWADGTMKPHEVDALFALNDALVEPSAEWSDFFVEAIGELVVNGSPPRGYVSDDNARWLIDRIDRDGALQGMTELELLVRVLERATNSPAALKAYVLEQVERAVVTGEGPTRRGKLAPGLVNADEAAILRRVLFAPGGEGPASVSCAEAEMLFRIKDAALGAANAPEWKQMFVQGVANYLETVASRTAQLSRERAAELEAFMADDSTRVAGFVGRMLNSQPAAFRTAFRTAFEGDEPQRDRLAEMAEARVVTADERKWLDARVDGDGTVDEYEQALIAFLAAD